MNLIVSNIMESMNDIVTKCLYRWLDMGKRDHRQYCNQTANLFVIDVILQRHETAHVRTTCMTSFWSLCW